jgi:hypothetical protein
MEKVLGISISRDLHSVRGFFIRVVTVSGVALLCFASSCASRSASHFVPARSTSHLIIRTCPLPWYMGWGVNCVEKPQKYIRGVNKLAPHYPNHKPLTTPPSPSFLFLLRRSCSIAPLRSRGVRSQAGDKRPQGFVEAEDDMKRFEAKGGTGITTTLVHLVEHEMPKASPCQPRQKKKKRKNMSDRPKVINTRSYNAVRYKSSSGQPPFRSAQPCYITPTCKTTVLITTYSHQITTRPISYRPRPIFFSMFSFHPCHIYFSPLTKEMFD